MNPTLRTTPGNASIGDPEWEIAELLPKQGNRTEEGYLALGTNHLVEFDNGIVEVLPLPTRNHQLIVAFLYEVLKAFVVQSALGGKVFFAPYRLRVAPGKYREPDVMYLSPQQDARAEQQFTDQAELVIEVMSPDDVERDRVTKRAEYARVGIPEYWLVDQVESQILVLRLQGDTYVEHGRFAISQRRASHRFSGLGVSVEDVFNSCL